MRLLVLLSGLTVGFAAQCTRDEWSDLQSALDLYSVTTGEFVGASSRAAAVGVLKVHVESTAVASITGKDSWACVEAKWSGLYDLYQTGNACEVSPTSYGCTHETKLLGWREDYCSIANVGRKCSRWEYTQMSTTIDTAGNPVWGAGDVDAFKIALGTYMGSSASLACYTCLEVRAGEPHNSSIC